MTYQGQIRSAVESLTLHGATGYAWLAETGPAVPPTSLRRALRDVLYTCFYTTGGPVPFHSAAGPRYRVAFDHFRDGLQQANQGRGFPDPGWRVHAVEPAQLVVTKGHLQLSLPRAAGTPAPKPGETISVRMPAFRNGPAQGFCFAFSDEPFPYSAGPLLRLYWHITAAGAIPLFRHATRLLNANRIPFQLKTLSDSHAYRRADAAVLYLPQSAYPNAHPLLKRLHQTLRPFLQGAVPALTKPLAWGVGFAEDPGDAASFGAHRCEALAEGLLLARDRKQSALEERLATVAEVLAGRGISLDRPYLNPGSTANYDPLTPSLRPPKPKFCTPPPPGETAARIASQLAASALWHQDRCNWVAIDAPVDRGLLWQSLDASLFNGAAGVGLFLARCSALTGDRQVERTAIGALAGALARARKIAPANRFGHYAGGPGIAVAALTAGQLLSQDSLITGGAALLRATLSQPAAPAEHDLVFGRAGAICSLLIAAQSLPDPTLIPLAATLGDELIAAATAEGGGWAWKGLRHQKERPWTGFSHGASGIAFAFLQLAKASAEPRFLHAAQMAQLYERSVFDHRASNWPDFRGSKDTRQQRRRSARCASFWCHGAPGIALTRLATQSAQETQLALAATQAAFGQMLQSPSPNCSLCHGLLGLAEILEIGGRKGAMELAAAAALESARRNGGIFPCDFAGETPPALLTGLAGIGHFFLRLHDPAVPSVLWPAA